MRILLNTTTITILALALPIAALADLGPSTITLNNNQALNLDTGTAGASGSGDIFWNGSAFALQGNALVSNIISGGVTSTSLFSQLVAGGSLALSKLTYSRTVPFPAVNSVFAIRTNGSNYAVVLVVNVGVSGSVQLQFATFGSTGSSGPTITQVLNNYGLIPAGFPNSGIAQGSLFIIKGSGLADPNAQFTALQDSTKGLPTTLNGASVKVTVNGVTTVPAFYYANVFSSGQQLALVLPSNTPTGSGQVTVTYNGQTSAPYAIQVVTSAMGFLAYSGGTGLGVAVNTSAQAAGQLYTYASTIVPGSTVLLYGSGLGADSARDTQYVGAAFNINALAHIYVGGVDAQIVYQGASGFPGLNQVNLTIPTNAPPGCNVSVIGVTAAGIPTNTITLPIANGAPCSDPAFGILDGRTLTSLGALTTVRTGFIGVNHSTVNGQATDNISAVFQKISGVSFGTGSGSASFNSCVVNQNLVSSGGSVPTISGMDAGTVTVTGPVGTTQTLTAIPQILGVYSAFTGQGGTLPSGFIPSTGGFAFHGTGGTSGVSTNNVGNFSTTVSLSNPLMTWDNQSAASTVIRSGGLPVAWSNGTPGSFVIISGFASSSGASATFTCIVSGTAGQFTVPGYVLNALPAGTGGVIVSNYSNFNTFTASNLDFAYAAGSVSYSVTSTFN